MHCFIGLIRFVGFKEAENTTGAALASLFIVKSLEELGHSLEDCRGQFYMYMTKLSLWTASRTVYKLTSSNFNILQSTCLKSCGSKACKSGAFKCICSIINVVSDFFLSSPWRVKLQEILVDETVASVTSGSETKRRGKAEVLKRLYAARWVESHQTVLIFTELLPVTARGLEQLLDCGAPDADAHLASLRTSAFLTCAVVVEKVVAMILSISTELQRPSMLLGDALARAIRTQQLQIGADSRRCG